MKITLSLLIKILPKYTENTTTNDGNEQFNNLKDIKLYHK
jgi:hypothetical protein